MAQASSLASPGSARLSEGRGGRGGRSGGGSAAAAGGCPAAGAAAAGTGQGARPGCWAAPGSPRWPEVLGTRSPGRVVSCEGYRRAVRGWGEGVPLAGGAQQAGAVSCKGPWLLLASQNRAKADGALNGAGSASDASQTPTGGMLQEE